MRTPSELSVHSGAKHSQRKGLGDVVIRTGFESRDDIHFHVIGREQNHRHIPAFPELPEQLQPIAVREIDIQNQQIERTQAQCTPGLLQRGAESDLHGLALQRQLNPASQRRIVLQQEDFLHHKHLPSLPLSYHIGR